MALFPKRINGGYNGLDDRTMYYERAKKVLSQNDSADAGTATPDTSAPATDATQPSSDASAQTYPGSPLRQGNTGDAVRTMQQRLSDLGNSLSVDGNFGPGTKAAVVAFQGSKGLSTDGVVGPATWAALWG